MRMLSLAGGVGLCSLLLSQHVYGSGIPLVQWQTEERKLFLPSSQETARAVLLLALRELLSE